MLVKRKSEYPLYIAFIWHMHQPWYFNSDKDIAIFPWVRTHSIKDYLDMVSILNNYPNIKQTFNLVPSLVEQIKLISEKKVSDKYLNISLKPASELSSREKEFIIKWMCPPSNIKRIAHYEPYRKFLYKVEDLKRDLRNSLLVIDKLTEQDYRDLQLWFDLSWFDPIYIENNQFLGGLVEKSNLYNEDEKNKLYNEQLKIIKRIIPKYKKMEEEKRIELISSPYYHPILPLLIDSKVAIEANQNCKAPDNHFSFLGDAKAQIEMGLDFHKSIFGLKPAGVWSPEMAISNESLKILAESGIFWTIADQGILNKSIDVDISLGNDRVVRNPHILYKPYVYYNDNYSINLIFRDRILSDLIGFTYNNMSWEDAVNDFIDRLERIYFSVSSHNKPYLVTIALDGENCWEYYEKDGVEFLSNLYQELNERSQFKLVCISDYLKKHPSTDKLYLVKSGSWIRGDFSNWIGGECQNQAWDFLYQTRIDVEKAISSGIERKKRDRILKEIYITEGSDWFWWLGDNEKSGMDELWEYRFREHLHKIYEILEISPPNILNSPINIT